MTAFEQAQQLADSGYTVVPTALFVAAGKFVNKTGTYRHVFIRSEGSRTQVWSTDCCIVSRFKWFKKIARYDEFIYADFVAVKQALALPPKPVYDDYLCFKPDFGSPEVEITRVAATTTLTTKISMPYMTEPNSVDTVIANNMPDTKSPIDKFPIINQKYLKTISDTLVKFGTLYIPNPAQRGAKIMVNGRYSLRAYMHTYEADCTILVAGMHY